jgi:cytoskeletal protein CcmA (bactofilin family)
MYTFGRSIALKGELRASEDITIEGQVEGPISCENSSVVVSASADVTGRILARDIIVFGRMKGELIATKVVDIRPNAVVRGQVVSKRFILDEEALFNGRVAPQRLDAALAVTRYQQRQRENVEEVC